MIDPVRCPRGALSPCREESDYERDYVLPRDTKVMTGNCRMKSILICLHGVMTKIVVIGG